MEQGIWDLRSKASNSGASEVQWRNCYMARFESSHAK